MKRLLAVLSLMAATGMLSGCYIAPDYGYVQSNGYTGDVYYGTAPAAVYGYGYYAPWYYGYPYYGYYGCCWGPGVIVGGGWYGGRYYRGGYGGHYGHGHATAHGSAHTVH
jgi:hypothetical protein